MNEVLLSVSKFAVDKVMTLGTGFRNIAAALLIGEEDFKDREISVMLVIAALTGLFVLVPVTLAWRRSSPPARPILNESEALALRRENHS